MPFSAKLIKDQDKGWTRIVAGIKGLERDPADALEVGWFTPEIAQRAQRNEYGTKHIPERPFIRPTIDGNQARYLAMMAQGLERAALGQTSRRLALVPTANAIRTDLIRKIIDVRSPPNAPGTIAAKGSSNPLVEEGEMQRDIQIKVVAGRGGGE